MPGISAARRRLLQLAKPEISLPKSPNYEVTTPEPIKNKANDDIEQRSLSDDEPSIKQNFDDSQSGWTIGAEPIKNDNDDGKVVVTDSPPNEQVSSKAVEDSWPGPDSKPLDEPTKQDSPAKEDIETNNDNSGQDEWDQLSKVPYEQRKQFLREMTTVPPEQVVETNPLSSETKKHRLQMLLAEHKFGIPSLALAEEYEKMFDHKLDVQEWGYEMLSSLIADMSDVITVQEPDEISGLCHPKYPNDRILLDKRYGHQFTSQPQLIINRNTSTSGIGSVCESESEFDALINRARINHDCDFPEDVVLPGEQYTEPILMKTAQVEGTRGVYTCLITGAANPNHFYLNLKNDYTKIIETFTSQVKQYFGQGNRPIEAYRVPEEFIYPGFVCLRQRKSGPWERVAITGRSLTDDRILVESVDFGGTDAVSNSQLRLMPRKFLSAPRQAIVVSLFGIKPPTEAKRYSSSSGQKIAGWSYEYYWMECLFLEPKPVAVSSKESTAGDSDSATVDQQHCLEIGSPVSTTCPGDLKNMSTNKRIMYRKPQFEVIILDRMVPSYDAFIDEILVAQLTASYIAEYKEELKRLKGELKKAITDIPCHENPMEKSYREHGHI